jgi:hypothetical protein
LESAPTESLEARFKLRWHGDTAERHSFEKNKFREVALAMEKFEVSERCAYAFNGMERSSYRCR